MTLKAVLFSFTGVVMNDEHIRQTLSEQILLAENLRPNRDDYIEVCIGRSDRACLNALLMQRGRNATNETLDKLLTRESDQYHTWLNGLDKLPIYPGLEDLIFRCRAKQLKMALVTGVERAQVISVLERAGLLDHFESIVTGSELSVEGSKPAPDSYLESIGQLNRATPNLQLRPSECLAVDATFAGIAAAKNADIPVIGVAHIYPNHMLQRRATWVVDYLREIKFDWIGEKFGGAVGNSTQLVSDPGLTSAEASS